MKPSHKSTTRTPKLPAASAPFCPYCGDDADLVTGELLYPSRPDLAEKRFWRCSICDAHVGTHAGNPQKGIAVNTPLGTLANAELRRARSRAHAAFDPVWKSGTVTRSEAYAALAIQLQIRIEDCHIAMFDERRCAQVVALVADLKQGRSWVSVP